MEAEAIGVEAKTIEKITASTSLMSSSEKLMNFMHFHNFCTRNCNHHILSIMTGNDHKESCHKSSFILAREKGLKHNQN